MTADPDITNFVPTLSADEITNGVLNYLERMRTEGRLNIEPSPQCRICRDPAVLGLVNKMLSRAFTPTDVLNTMEAYNQTLPKRRRITYDSIYKHTRNHFPIQEPATAVLRELNERRYEEAGNDFTTGVGTMVTYMSYLETMMIRGSEQLMDPTVSITADQGMKAAVKLAEVQRKDEGLLERAQLLARMNRVIELVRKFVPQERWPELQAALAGDTHTVEAIEAAVTGEVSPEVHMVHIADESDEEEEQR